MINECRAGAVASAPWMVRARIGSGRPVEDNVARLQLARFESSVCYGL